MPIKPECVEEIIEDIAAKIRAANPAHMEITYAYKARSLAEHGAPSSALTVGDELTITIEMKR